MFALSNSALIRTSSFLPILAFVFLSNAGLFSRTGQAQDPLIRINAGSTIEVTHLGTTFIEDIYYSESTVGPVISSTIEGTTNDALYQTERLTNDAGDPFSYDIPVPQNGTYSINLHFAETAFDQVGMRVFDIIVEGLTVFDNYDIMSAAQDNNTAHIETIVGVEVMDGTLTIEFIAETERAKVNGIEVFGAATPVDIPFLLNAGGLEYVSSTETWLEDDGTYFLEGTELTIGDPITGTVADELYQSERFGNDVDPLRFLLPGVAEGNYTLELHFAENFHQNAGERIFDVVVEGTELLENYDIFLAAGGKNVAHVEMFENVSVTDGILNITLEPVLGSTTLNAIAITSASLVSNEDEQALPDEYTLTAAYPNPFNPATQFTLSLGRTQQVAINVYNVLGQRVATLFEGMLSGQKNHAFTFEASNQPSGIYLIQVTGEQFNRTQQVILLK